MTAPTDTDAGLVERLPPMPDSDDDFTPEVGRKIIALYVKLLARQDARIASLSAEVERLTALIKEPSPAEVEAWVQTIDNEKDRRALAAEARLASIEAEVRAACVAAVPTNWCDPLLTGPDVPRGPLDNRGVEKLLLGIIERIRAAAIRSGGEG